MEATMVALKNGLFLDVDVKEALGQAVVIATCQTLEGTKALGVQQVDGRLDEAVEQAMLKAVAKFVEVDWPSVKASETATGSEEPSDSERNEESMASPEPDITDIPDDFGDIPDDIPEEVISEEIRYSVEMSDDEVPTESAEPVIVTGEDVEPENPEEIADFRLNTAIYQGRSVLVSEEVAKILAGDERAKRNLQSMQSCLELAKRVTINENTRAQAEKFIRYAAAHGVM